MDIQKEREAFEQDWRENNLPFTGDAEFKEYAWRAWQAAKAQAVLEWFDYTKQSPQMDGNYQIFIKGEQITAKWVSRFGFADPIEGDALRQELITHWAMQPQPPKAQEPTQTQP